MTNLELARRVAEQLDLLDSHGELAVLDSLAILDYATQLETETGHPIPTAELKDSSFSSFEAVATLLERVAGRSDKPS